MDKFFDKKNNRLVYIGQGINSSVWDSHWDKQNIKQLYRYKKINDYVVKYTKKYLKQGSKILEGGCGLGQQVFKLQNEGYNVIGIDYAQKTVDLLHNIMPELDIRYGDVRDLNFKNQYFDGYWSFGVIEHFYNGYDKIASEMYRVLKKNGYLFITFPHLSKLRRIKSKHSKYKNWSETEELIKNFYQFALDEKKVIEYFQNLGFKLIETKKLSGIKGLKDEISFLKNLLQKIYDSNNFFVRVLAFAISALSVNFTSHAILCIFEKK